MPASVIVIAPTLLAIVACVKNVRPAYIKIAGLASTDSEEKMSSSKKARNLIQQKVDHAELKAENGQLLKKVEELASANNLLKLMLQGAEESAERYRQDAVRREVDNQYLEGRNYWLREEIEPLRQERDAAETAQKKAEGNHDHAKEGIRNKMRMISELRNYLTAEVLALEILPDHADTHMECYPDRELVTELVKAVKYERSRAGYWISQWNITWKGNEKLLKRLNSLKRTAAAVYDFCFEDDSQKPVRNLRRVLDALGVFIVRGVEPKQETPVEPEKGWTYTADECLACAGLYDGTSDDATTTPETADEASLWFSEVWRAQAVWLTANPDCTYDQAETNWSKLVDDKAVWMMNNAKVTKETFNAEINS